jgi:hypothetical protein
MGIEELNFSSAVLSGANFVSLAELVADLAASNDVSYTEVPLTFLEMQNLVKSFGIETMTKLGRQGKIDASNQFWWTLPLSEVKALSEPVVVGTDTATSLYAAKNTNLGEGDHHFLEGVAQGFKDISNNKCALNATTTNTNQKILDEDGKNVATPTGDYTFPHGTSLDAIDWYDLSAVVKAKNIRFDERSRVTDVSAIQTLFRYENNAGTAIGANAFFVNDNAIGRSKHRLNNDKAAKVFSSNFEIKTSMDASYDERDRDYLNFLNLFVPTPNFRDVSQCGIATIAPYLEAGLFKNIVGYGLNKEYLTNASTFKKVIRNNVRGCGSTLGANLVPEFQILKEYGFPKSKVYAAYADALAHGVVGTTGLERTSDSLPAVIDRTLNAPLNTPAHIQNQFNAVFGSAGVLADQLSDFEQDETFNDSDGITSYDAKAAIDVKGWVEYIQRMKDFIQSDKDFNWSTTGIAGPINLLGSKRETWAKFQKLLKVDPRLSHLPELTLSNEQDERLRILLETLGHTDSATGGMAPSAGDLEFSSYGKNNMTLGIPADVADNAVYVRDGKFFDQANNEITRIDASSSIWSVAVKHGWTDATEVYGNLKGSGIFMMDNVYNVRSRIEGLDRLSNDNNGNSAFTSEEQLVNYFKNASALSRGLLRNDQISIALDGKTINSLAGSTRRAHEYFTPQHFQEAFFDMTNLQHTANVALRYFDLDNSAGSAVDIYNKNILNTELGVTGNVVQYRLPLAIMTKVPVDVPDDYADVTQQSRVAWVYNALVKPSMGSTKAALAEITSWSPVPANLYVDTSDVTGYVLNSERVAKAKVADINGNADYIYATEDATLDNRSLPGCMVHVMANYFAKATAYDTANSDSDLIALLDLHPTETLRAFNRMNSGSDANASTIATLQNGGNTYNLLSNPDPCGMITRILQALVHYGKPASYFASIGACAKIAINAYEAEVKKWATDMTNTMGVFGDDADVFSMVQHLGYWVPYLSQYTPEEIAEVAAADDDIQNISDEARALMLGLLLAATRGGIASSRQSDAGARLAGLNAFHNAGIPRTLIDIAFTSRGINVFANLAGSRYEQ